MYRDFCAKTTRGLGFVLFVVFGFLLPGTAYAGEGEPEDCSECTVIYSEDEPTWGSKCYGSFRYCVDHTTATDINFNLPTSPPNNHNAVWVDSPIEIKRSMSIRGQQTQVFAGPNRISPLESLLIIGNQPGGLVVNIQGFVFLGSYEEQGILIKRPASARNNVTVSLCEFGEFGIYGVPMNGGVIHVEEENDLTVTQSKFVNNESDEGTAIYAIGANVIINFLSKFENNISSGYGGAIYMQGSFLTVSDSNFTSNYANGRGGAIHSRSGLTDISNSEFLANYGNAGGAIHSDRSNLTVSDSSFTENHAISGGAGGAIFFSSLTGVGAQLEVTRANFQANSAGALGGALLLTGENAVTNRITESRFEQNFAKTGGGGIYLGQGNLEMETSVLFNNIIDRGSSSLTSHGGGVWVGGGNFYAENSTFFQNGGLYGIQFTYGGNISVDSAFGLSTSAILNHCTITEGIAQFGGGISAIGPFAMVDLINTIIAYSPADSLGGECYFIGSTLKDTTSLDSGSTCGLMDPASISNDDPLLMPLDTYGFSTEHQPIMDPSSPAVDTADSSFCPVIDQIGNPRPPGSCDIGAIESW